MKSYFIVVILFSFLLISNGCKEKQPEVAEVSKELFYGKIVYSSIVEATDTVFKLNMEAISPYKIDIYVDENNFRMIEYGGLSHSNLILDKTTCSKGISTIRSNIFFIFYFLPAITLIIS